MLPNDINLYKVLNKQTYLPYKEKLEFLLDSFSKSNDKLSRNYTPKNIDIDSLDDITLIVYEDNITNGPGAEICSIVSDRYFDLLDGPVRRIASKDSPIPYNWFLEEKVLIQTADIANAINSLLEY